MVRLESTGAYFFTGSLKDWICPLHRRVPITADIADLAMDIPLNADELSRFLSWLYQLQTQPHVY